jgi:hypothetical protein
MPPATGASGALVGFPFPGIFTANFGAETGRARLLGLFFGAGHRGSASADCEQHDCCQSQPDLERRHSAAPVRALNLDDVNQQQHTGRQPDKPFTPSNEGSNTAALAGVPSFCHPGQRNAQSRRCPSAAFCSAARLKAWFDPQRWFIPALVSCLGTGLPSLWRVVTGSCCRQSSRYRTGGPRPSAVL